MIKQADQFLTDSNDERNLSEYSYIMTIFDQCKEEQRAIKQLFTDEQIEQLNEIN